jgi:type IV pilus assembly protein PilQ
LALPSSVVVRFVKAAASSTTDERAYTGRRVDFNVKDMDIKNLLSAIAEISRRNIIVADDVSGNVTIKLRNVPWDQALDIILRAKGLGREEVGNIIRVAERPAVQAALHAEGFAR